MKTKFQIINELLLYDDPAHWRFRQHQWAFFVHESIFEKFAKLWHKSFTNSVQKIFEYSLKIDMKHFDMRIIYVTLDYTEEIEAFRELIKNSQYSFPWEENATLFVNARSFTVLQQFIKTNELENHVLKIDDLTGITANSENIKLVTFDESVSPSSTIKKFQNYISSITTYQQPQYYYITFVFPWLQPRWLDHFKISISNACYVVFPILLNHLKSLSYTNELNIFELLSFRLAFCDHFSSAMCLVKHDIDVLIKQKLRKLVKNKHLNVDRYENATSYVPRDLLINYLVYEFQDSLLKITTRPRETFQPRLGPDKPKSIIELAHETDVFTRLDENRNTTFYIDGRNFKRMSFSFFMKLAECDNVTAIFLDINYPWISDACDPSGSLSPVGGRIYIFLVGGNYYNFIEDFVLSLKSILFTMKTFSLHIHCNLNDYRIFDNLTVYRIDFIDMKIDKKMLHELHKSNLNAMVRVYNCTFENSSCNWALLNNLRTLNHVELQEDEGTWHSMFEFIWDELDKSKTSEFQFKRKTLIMCDEKLVSLDGIKFKVDEEMSKLVLCNINRNDQIIDLYDLKYDLESDDKFDYEFYQ